MAFPEAATLELGLWALIRGLAVVFAAFHASKTIRSGKNFVDVFGVIGPVGRNIEGPADCEPVRHQ